MRPENDLVGAFEESYSLQVLVAIVHVRDPLARIARVVEVEHGGDGVDPEAVDVVFRDPEQGVGEEVVPNLGAAVVEDERPPVGVPALAGVGVVVEVGAVEEDEAVGVLGEVRRDPVDEHA